MTTPLLLHGSSVVRPHPSLRGCVVFSSDFASSSPSFDGAVREARAIFELLCPGEEFLPRAPDYDEIVHPTDEDHDGSDGKSDGEGGNDDGQRGEGEEQDAGQNAQDNSSSPGTGTHAQNDEAQGAPGGDDEDEKEEEQHHSSKPQTTTQDEEKDRSKVDNED